MKLFVSALAALLLAACATTAAAPQLSVSRPTTPGPVFGSTMAPGTPNATFMTEHGYREDEYFVSGKANIYRYGANGRPDVAQADVPYTTRVLIVRPSDAARFSGRVIYEPTHPFRGGTAWPALREMVVRDGDAYVTVFTGSDARARSIRMPDGSAADSLNAMLESAPQRYAPIKWPSDNGVTWDMFGQVSQLLRSDSGSNPLHGLTVKRMYATGWSATGSYLRTYINEGFHERYRRANGAPTIDGYVFGISQGSYTPGYSQISDGVPLAAANDPRRRPRPIDSPVIEIMSESEAITKSGPPVEDVDANPGRHRYYEIPGVTHTDALGVSTASPQCPYGPTQVPFRYFTYAAFENVDRWVSDGVAPPRQGEPIMPLASTAPGSAAGHVAAKDAQGNATGGVRSAEIVVPLARFGATGITGCRSPAPDMLEMHSVPFDRSQLASLYPGGATEYLRRYEAQLDRLIGERWLLPRDKDFLMQQARARAADAFH